MKHTALLLLATFICTFCSAAAREDISIKELELTVRPMQTEELTTEADAWLNLLETKAKDISAAEISNASAQELIKLREAQTNVIDRLNVVVKELSTKGGVVDKYNKYVASVSRVSVSGKNLNKTFSVVVNWLKSPTGGIRWGGRIIAFFAIIILFHVLAAITERLVRKTLRFNKRCSKLLREFFSTIISRTLIVIGWVVGAGTLGVNVGPMIAGIGAIGFIVGFALQGTLSNFASGVMILMYRPYDVGDAIKTAGISGSVVSMNLNTTTIMTWDNQVLVVPNGSIWGNVITNITGCKERRVDLVFSIGYKDDIAKAHAILTDIVKQHPLVLAEPAPNIRLHELADSSVNFICRPWTKTENYWDVYWDIIRTVKERFDAEGVGIPFPQRDVHIYRGK
ncbi:MAG: mechanosensitive ion channel family protein [Phycisphaerae bacterium]